MKVSVDIEDACARAHRGDGQHQRVLTGAGLQIENWRLAPSEVRETPGEYRVVRVAQTRITLTA
jgi:hypothetical protein